MGRRPSQISFIERVRDGDRKVRYLDVVIDGSRLTDLYEVAERDMVSCFDYANIEASTESVLALTLDEISADFGSMLPYVCPLCADIGCGAVQIMVSRTQHDFSWSRFAYVNGFDDPIPLPIGPFKFEMRAYLSAVRGIPERLTASPSS